MIEHRAGVVSIEVPVAMVGQIDHCRSRCCSCQLQSESAIIAPRVTRLDIEFTGIVFLAIGADTRENDGIVIVVNTRFPNLILEAFGAAMKSVRAIVDGQLIVASIDAELASGDAVGITSGDFTGTRTVGNIVGRISVAKSDIGKVAFAVGDFDTDDSGSEA